MPSVLTGANLANRDLIYLGVSGDGDSASIGFGQFAHSLRRGVNMVYIVENNGVYGLTKGQFSATADKGSKSKKGAINADAPIDLVGMALQLGATFVARGFSGDKVQLVPLIKAALLHRGAAFLDVLSPCVAFNNHVGSTKSYDYVREHNDAVSRLDFISPRSEITAEYESGSVEDVVQHDGSVIRLRKLHADYDAHDRITAMTYLQERQAAGEVVTGLLYVDPDPDELHAQLNTADTLSTSWVRASCARVRARWKSSTRPCAEHRPRRRGASAVLQRRQFMRIAAAILLILGLLFGPGYYLYSEHFNGRVSARIELTERAERWTLPMDNPALPRTPRLSSGRGFAASRPQSGAVRADLRHGVRGERRCGREPLPGHAVRHGPACTAAGDPCSGSTGKECPGGPPARYRTLSAATLVHTRGTAKRSPTGAAGEARIARER